MSDSIQTTLTSAFEMIEVGHPDRAVTLLQPLLTQAADNPDVWWVYAHAVTDPQVAHAALTRVLRLEPGYPEAVALLRRLEKQLRAQRANLMRERPPASALSAGNAPPYNAAPTPPNDFPEMPLADEGGGYLGGGFHMLLVLVAIGMIAVVALLALEPQLSLWFPSEEESSGNSAIIRTWVPTTVATQENVIATDTLTSKDNPTPAEEEVMREEVAADASDTPAPSATPASTRRATQLPLITSTPAATAVAMPNLDVSALLAAVPEFELRQNELLRPAPEGWYVVLALCGVRGTAEAVQQVQDNLVSMAAASAELPSIISALAIELLDCETNETLSVVGVERAAAQKFAAGGMTEKALRARFHPLFEG